MSAAACIVKIPRACCTTYTTACRVGIEGTALDGVAELIDSGHYTAAMTLDGLLLRYLQPVQHGTCKPAPAPRKPGALPIVLFEPSRRTAPRAYQTWP